MFNQIIIPNWLHPWRRKLDVRFIQMHYIKIFFALFIAIIIIQSCAIIDARYNIGVTGRTEPLKIIVEPTDSARTQVENVSLNIIYSVRLWGPFPLSVFSLWTSDSVEISLRFDLQSNNYSKHYLNPSMVTIRTSDSISYKAYYVYIKNDKTYYAFGGAYRGINLQQMDTIIAIGNSNIKSNTECTFDYVVPYGKENTLDIIIDGLSDEYSSVIKKARKVSLKKNYVYSLSFGHDGSFSLFTFE